MLKSLDIRLLGVDPLLQSLVANEGLGGVLVIVVVVLQVDSLR